MVLESIKVKPLAFDSLGVRSMATYVKTIDLEILIDPAVALGPKRYGLPPHPREWERLRETWDLVKEYAAKSDILVITHYHYDHHNPEEIEIYRDKTVYLKDPKVKINRSQKERAAYFLKNLEGVARDFEVADGRAFQHRETTIKFSPPVYHGTNPRLGYVVQISISSKGEKIVFSSDVEGPSVEEQAAFVLEESPNLLILDGPMTYMLGYRYSRESLNLALRNINRIIKETLVETIILDHHFMRDLKYRERLSEVYSTAAENGVKVVSAAEYAGREPDMLEARRRELYGMPLKVEQKQL
jgi:predicted metallo-beta-lactamase superfamily hydrolase